MISWEMKSVVKNQIQTNYYQLINLVNLQYCYLQYQLEHYLFHKHIQKPIYKDTIQIFLVKKGEVFILLRLLFVRNSRKRKIYLFPY